MIYHTKNNYSEPQWYHEYLMSLLDYVSDISRDMNRQLGCFAV